jgi:ribonuclease D
LGVERSAFSVERSGYRACRDRLMISRFLPLRLRRLLGVKTVARMPAYQLIDHRVEEVSLDTEADNMFHYKTRLCLLQFLVDGEVFLVDALAGLPLDGLWQRLAQKHIVMHGSDFDLRLLHDLCRFRPKSIFDTMLAAQLLNRPRVGLASLLEDHFGVKLSKESQKMLDYAALDVWHLPALRDLLTRELVRLRRVEWLEQQCLAQIEAGLTGFAAPDENDWRIGQSERLRGPGLSVLHAVWHWREESAKRLDTPPFKVCGNKLLLQISEAAEAGESADAILAKVHLGKRHTRLFPSLETAVRDGIVRDPHTLPRRRGRDRNHAALTNAEVALQDRIRSDRDKLAAKLSIEPTLIATRSQLAQIARKPRQIDEVLLPWQADLLRNIPALKQG